MNKFTYAVASLLEKEPFFAHFLLNSKVLFDAHGVETAAAGVSEDSVMLIFNSKFMDNLSTPELMGVIKHEILHLVCSHPHIYKRDRTLTQGPNSAVNWATDCTINQYIEALPKGSITLALVNRVVGRDLEPFQTWEYYYNALLPKAQKIPQAGPGDDHDKMLPDLANESQQQAIVKNATCRAMNSAAGNVSQEVLKLLDAFQQSPQLPWQQILRNFIARHTASSIRYTRKKVNRRFGLRFPGKLKKRELILGVCADSSGSVSDKNFNAFLNEVQAISDSCLKTHFIDADCEVKTAITLKKKEKIKFQRTGNGGTAYQPAIDKCMKLGCQAIIYFGDFDCADRPRDPGIPFLWVGVGQSPAPAEFGQVIRLKS